MRNSDLVSETSAQIFQISRSFSTSWTSSVKSNHLTLTINKVQCLWQRRIHLYRDKLLQTEPGLVDTHSHLYCRTRLGASYRGSMIMAYFPSFMLMISSMISLMPSSSGNPTFQPGAQTSIRPKDIYVWMRVSFKLVSFMLVSFCVHYHTSLYRRNIFELACKL